MSLRGVSSSAIVAENRPRRSFEEPIGITNAHAPRGLRDNNRRFADNWELSAQRALTVTRTLIEEGIPSSPTLAAAFGSEQAVASNADPDGRSKNRRVEMAPTPRPSNSEKKPA